MPDFMPYESTFSIYHATTISNERPHQEAELRKAEEGRQWVQRLAIRATYKFLEVLELVHVRLEDRDGARPMVREDLADVFIHIVSWSFDSRGSCRWRVKADRGVVQVAQFGFIIAVVKLHRVVTIRWRVQADRLLRMVLVGLSILPGYIIRVNGGGRRCLCLCLCLGLGLVLFLIRGLALGGTVDELRLLLGIIGRRHCGSRISRHGVGNYMRSINPFSNDLFFFLRINSIPASSNWPTIREQRKKEKRKEKKKQEKGER